MSNRDKLNELFKGLRRRGLIARQGFSCCSGCGFAELSEALKERPEKIGCAFYHRQDRDHLHGRGWGAERAESVFIGFGAREGSGEPAVKEVGQIIVEEAERVGLECDWNGSAAVRVNVLLPGGIDAEG